MAHTMLAVFALLVAQAEPSITEYHFSEDLIAPPAESLTVPSPALTLPAAPGPCDAEQRALDEARERAAAGIAALRAGLDASPAEQRELSKTALVAERGLLACLEEAVAWAEPGAAYRLARFLAVTASAERRDPRRARSILERLPKTPAIERQLGQVAFDCQATSPTGDPNHDAYRCGWVALSRGDAEAAMRSFERAKQAADPSLVDAVRGGMAAAVATSSSAVALRRSYYAAWPAHAATAAERRLAEAMFAAGRLEAAAEVVSAAAKPRPPGSSRCLLLRSAARAWGYAADHTKAFDALKAVMEDVRERRSESEACARGLAEDFRAVATQWHREGSRTLNLETADASARAYAAFVELFPESPYAEDLRFYRAEVLWRMGGRGAPWGEVARAYANVVRTNPLGERGADSAVPLAMSVMNMLPSAASRPWDDPPRKPSLSGEDLALARLAATHAFRVFDERMATSPTPGAISATLGRRLVALGHLAEGASMLARSVASGDGVDVDYEQAVGAWNAIGAWDPLHRFLTEIEPPDRGLFELRADLRPLVAAKRCEGLDAAKGPCFIEIAEAGFTPPPFARRARQLAVLQSKVP